MLNTTIQVPITFTHSAITEIKRLMQQDGFDATKLLRVGVKGGGCSGMTYVLEFDHQEPADNVYAIEYLTFLINKSHELYLYGMQIDWQDGLNNRGFTFSNPNASATCGCGSSFAV